MMKERQDDFRRQPNVHRPFFELSRGINTLIALAAFWGVGLTTAQSNRWVGFRWIDYGGLALLAILIAIQGARVFDVTVHRFVTVAAPLNGLPRWIQTPLGVLIGLAFVVLMLGAAFVLVQAATGIGPMWTDARALGGATGSVRRLRAAFRSPTSSERLLCQLLGRGHR